MDNFWYLGGLWSFILWVSNTFFGQPSNIDLNILIRTNNTIEQGQIQNILCAWVYLKAREIQYVCVNTMGWGHSIYLDYFTIFNGQEHSSKSQSVLIILFNLGPKNKYSCQIITKINYKFTEENCYWMT